MESKPVDLYIKTFPEDIQEKLQQIRNIIKKMAPEAIESISYGMPSYKIYGRQLVYFAGFKNYIGFYALPSGHAEFSDELKHYKQGKGSVQFPNDAALPLDLIAQIVEFRMYENKEKYMKKLKK